MSEKTLIAVRYSYDPESPLITEQRPAHRAFIGTLHEQGKIIGSGPFTDGSGGALIVLQLDKDATLVDAIAIMDGDPFYTSGALQERHFDTWNPVINSIGY